MANERKQITTTLLQFYHQPVARVSLELFLSIGAVIFFALFAIRPTLLTMADLIKEIEDKRALDAKLGQKVAALGSAQNEYLSLQNRLVVLDQAIPSSPELITSLKIIEKLASEQKLVITSISIPEIPRETMDSLSISQLQRQTLSVNLTVSGEYPVIRQFVESLRNSRRTFLVQSISFSVSDERTNKQLQATITLGMPYFGGKK